jgi:hypothetical protein
MIGPSTIRDAGEGAFAKKNLKKGKRIAKYHGGPRLTVRRAKSSQYQSYAFTDDDANIAIDPIDEFTHRKTCLAAYINDPLDGSPDNAEFQVIGDEVFVVTKAPIPRNHEVLMNYTAGYWTSTWNTLVY